MTPLVSIVVALRRVPPSLGEAFAAIADQDAIEDAEVIVADGSSERAGVELARRYSSVRRLELLSATLPELKGRAIREARGEMIAIVDPWDAPAPGWLLQIASAFSDPEVAGVGGSVVFAGAPTAVNRAAFLFEYAAFEPPLRAGSTDGDLPGNNVAYRRERLRETCGDLIAEGFTKPFVHERLRRSGCVLALREEMQVRHLRDDRLGPFARRLFDHGRCFGAVRRRRASLGRRIVLIAGAPAVAPLLVGRHLVRAGRASWATRAALAGFCVAWALGEWLGAWLGPGGSCERVD